MPAEIPKTISGDINLTTSSKIGLNLAPFPKIINSGDGGGSGGCFSYTRRGYLISMPEILYNSFSIAYYL
jgi:hypothetical protein